MKRIILLIIFIYGTTLSYAQKIHFTDTSNHWTIYSTTGWPLAYATYYNHYQGDTIKDSVFYHMLYESCLLLVREDTITSKVFVRALDLPTCGLDTVETLLYDYNWQLDDSVHSYVETNHFIHYVSAIDSTLINATWHKVWHFKYTFTAFISSRDYDVIEGIGCTQSLLFPLHPVAFESHDKLICFENNSSTPAVSPTVSGYFNNTTSCSLSIEDLPAHYAKSSVVPNPINESATLRLPKRLNSGTLKIYNAVGQLITEMPFQNKTELPIGDKIYVHSLYYYQVTGADGEVYTGKFTF